MKRYLVTWLVLALVALIFIGHPQRFTQSGASAGQRRGTRRPAPAPARKPGIDYSTFSHATKEHKGACNTCHKVPTANWKKVREFPDVADFPDHDACVRCHRLQFFKGPQPVICRDCHIKSSPRDEARLSFRNPSRPQQFTIKFPHDKHQDVIAELRHLLEPVSSFTFRRASFAFPVHAPQDKPKVSYNNCEICHATPTKLPAAPPRGWVDNFVPQVTAFKASPIGHASCFNCHWKSQRPVKDECGDCHEAAAAPYVPVEAPERKSMRFKHSTEQHVKECTACHINITKAAALRGLKPDVPITSCSGTDCHRNRSTKHEEIETELSQIDKNKQFICQYCHTSNVGKRDAPPSHYLAVERPPLRREDLK